MLRPYSHMIVADNSGAKEVRIITVLTNNKHQVGHVGDKCVVTVKKAAPNAAVVKGAVVKCVIVRTKREDSSGRWQSGTFRPECCRSYRRRWQPKGDTYFWTSLPGAA